FSLIMAVIYFIFTLAMVRVISKKWLWRIIAAVVLFVTPVAINVYLNLEHPLSWHNGRELLVLYVFLVVFFHLHFLVLNLLTPSALRGLNQHQQYLKLRDTFAPLKWAAKLFALPFLYFFWNSYLRRLEALRYENINCEQCHTALTLMNEDKDNEFLSAGQVKEEEIQSVDYDVWQCNTCFEHTILDYTNLESKAKKCKKCHFTTAVFSRKKVIQRATTSSEGYGCIYYVCAHCREETTEQYTIPKISTSSSSSSSSSGSSSSGSSSSSGGSSGGGGAGSSW
ncbi:MAG TPA: hypothetical protein VKB19_15330, partial [Pedobacter sp.]|nr:hypothetical protein [Pedobacter sp.]